eukprot:CAMPEP_0197700788 /NCGR_PEP_ID=MMETSP1338-20131121/122404_1 /TAXON_ID=43686 ORGANISM="Pelagodinium beii, Strain RCC1491" /NCGR_SAMPLE_ID=MMETSP1338 /ASSEMBLY_ACC=CAM_ASM_000754 /LENGTH=198 /DNA_ID=CAMNT_0043284429 /DNA_START=84 /DNA_END=680 /DNA_ORIENTATION=-
MDSAFAAPCSFTPRSRMWNSGVRIPSRTPSPYFTRRSDYDVTAFNPQATLNFIHAPLVQDSRGQMSITPRGTLDLRLSVDMFGTAKDYGHGEKDQSNGRTSQTTLKSYAPNMPSMPRTSWADAAEESEKTDSLGSNGHPFTCTAPCKFYFKIRGCKDGINCDRCHLCPWKKPQPDAPKGKMNKATAQRKKAKETKGTM